MATLTASSAISMDDLWPALGGTNIQAVVTATSSSYIIQLTNGTYVRYLSDANNFTYLGDAPSGGTYSVVIITNAAGTAQFGRLDNFGSRPLTGITSGVEFDAVMSGSDILQGIRANSTFRGGDSDDTLDLVTNGTGMTGAVIDGGQGNDILRMNYSVAGSYASLQGASIASIERLEFINTSGVSGKIGQMTLGSDQFGAGQLASNLQVQGATDDTNRLAVIATAAGSVDLGSLSFVNWSSTSFNWLHSDGAFSPNFAVSWTGTHVNDVFQLSLDDSAAGGSGDDAFYFWIINGTALASMSLDGGSGSNRLSLQSSDIDFRSATLSSIGKIEMTGVSTARFLADQIQSGFASSLVIDAAAGQSVIIDMGAVANLNLTGWSSLSPLGHLTTTINGDSSTEIITGSIFNDRIISGGGADFINGSSGDDIIEIDAAAFAPFGEVVGSFNGGADFDTLKLNFTQTNNFIDFQSVPATGLQSIEKLVVNNTSTSQTLATQALFNGHHFTAGSLSPLLQVDGGNALFALSISNTATTPSLNLGGLQFTNWHSSSYVSVEDSNASSTLTATNVADFVHGSGGNDIISTLAGNDTVFFDSNNGPVGGSVDGGGNTDTIRARFFSPSSIDFRDLAITSVERFSFQSLLTAASTTPLEAIFNASQLSGNFNLVQREFDATPFSSVLNLHIHMQNETLLNLTPITFQNWTDARVTITGDGDDENITGGASADFIFGGDGYDMLRGGAGVDTLDGGASHDTVDYSAETGNVFATLNGANSSFVFVNGYLEENLINIESIFGGSGNDTLIGDDAANGLYGGGGDDTIDGGGGSDSLFGDSNGIVGDTVSYASATAGVTVALNNGNGSGGGDFLHGFENATGSDHSDTLNGDDFRNVLRGGAGVDTLSGGAEHDVLAGGTGGDQLTGGTGNDWFVFAPSETTGDVVTDYAVGDTLYFGSSASNPVFAIAGSNVTVSGVTLQNANGGNVVAVRQASVGLNDQTQGTAAANVLANGHSALAAFGAYDRFEFDANINENWLTRKLAYNASGVLSQFLETLDTGATSTIVYDTNNQNWAYERTDRTPGGATSFNQFMYDSGARVNTVFDTGTLGNLTYSIDEFNAAGILQVRTDVYDDGKITNSYYTATGAPWYNREILPDGSRNQTNYDINNNQPWSSYTTFSNPAAQIYKEETYFDIGTRERLLYDVANASNWYQIQEGIDIAGNIDWTRTQYDNNSYVYTDIDQLDQFTWTYHVLTYNTAGQLVSDVFV